MKIGLTIPPESYAEACGSGYDYLELPGRAVCAMSDYAFDQLCAQTRHGNLPCYAMNAYCPPQLKIIGTGYDPDEAKAYAAKLAKRADALGVAVVGIGSPHSRILPQGYSRDTALKQAAGFFRLTAREFAVYGIKVCVEALGAYYCNFINTISEAQSLVDDVGEPNLGLVADFYNMEMNGEADISLQPYMGSLLHAHISDDAGDPTLRSYLKPEKREAHAARVAALKALGYSGGLTLEIDLRYSRDAARRSLELLTAM